MVTFEALKFFKNFEISAPMQLQSKAGVFIALILYIYIYFKIWVPDIVPFNLVEEPHYYTPTWDQGHKLIIYDNGNVIYAPQVNYKVSTA